MKKIALELSGGADSAAAAVILLEKGFDVTGLFLRLGPSGNGDDLASARSVADKLGVELIVLDMRDFFEKEIIKPFAAEYSAGRTPNPCVECNEKIKFGAALDFALENGFDSVATGHYAGTEEKDGGVFLKRAKSSKDQSYFLYRLTREKLAKILFPLGDLEKSQARATAERAGLAAARRRDSRELCFVPDGDYRSYLRSLGISSPRGKFVDSDGKVLGEHEGIINYTVGQRKGLGAFGKPTFAIKISAENNVVVLGGAREVRSKELLIDGLNFIAVDSLKSPVRANVKIRFRAAEKPATLFPEGDAVRAVFDEPLRAAAPGQSAVFYSGDLVLGGGRISEVR